jgi:Sec-independent protein translocase protein TatA
MFGFSTADWIFIALVMAVIFSCVAISDMVKKPGDE